LPAKKFLLWNINRKPLGDTVADLADEHAADLVVLLESKISPATMLGLLNMRPRRGGFHLTAGLSAAVTVFTRFSRDFIEPVFESDRVSIRKLSLPALPEILVAAVHFPSKLYWTSVSQGFECTELARQIEIEENHAGHRRTVLLGDFNMNPFEPGLVAAGGLNSVMSRQIAARQERTVQGRDYRFFYNPMWSHFGDAGTNTAGSYFYESSEHVSYFWNIFDQVLIRPELAEAFDTNRLKILTKTRTGSLTRPDGRPDGTLFSDHLPIVFELIL
jgi:hypothetical protein